MKIDKKLWWKLGLIAAAMVICFGCGMWAAAQPGSETRITSDLVSSRIEEIKELAVTEYQYTKVGKYENRLDFYGWKVPLTLKKFIISYDGEIKAGVDMGEAEIKVNSTGSSIEIQLPKAQVLSHEIDLESITVFDETKNLFNPIKITDYIEFSKDQQESAEQEAIDKGLLTEAQSRSEKVVKQWLSSLYGAAEDGPEIKVTTKK